MRAGRNEGATSPCVPLLKKEGDFFLAQLGSPYRGAKRRGMGSLLPSLGRKGGIRLPLNVPVEQKLRGECFFREKLFGCITLFDKPFAIVLLYLGMYICVTSFGVLRLFVRRAPVGARR